MSRKLKLNAIWPKKTFQPYWHFLFLTPVFLYHVIDNGGSAKANTKSKVKKMIIVSSVLSTGILFVGLCLVLYVWKKKQQKNSKYLLN